MGRAVSPIDQCVYGIVFPIVAGVESLRSVITGLHMPALLHPVAVVVQCVLVCVHGIRELLVSLEVLFPRDVVFPAHNQQNLSMSSNRHMIHAGIPMMIAPKLNAYCTACERPKTVIIPSTMTKYISTSARTATKILKKDFIICLNCKT